MDSMLIFKEVQGNELRTYEAIALSMKITFVLEDFIKEKGVSLQELAKAAGVSNNIIRKVFSGDKLVTLPMLAGISQTYNVRFDIIISPAKEMEGDNG